MKPASLDEFEYGKGKAWAKR